MNRRSLLKSALLTPLAALFPNLATRPDSFTVIMANSNSCLRIAVNSANSVRAILRGYAARGWDGIVTVHQANPGGDEFRGTYKAVQEQFSQVLKNSAAW